MSSGELIVLRGIRALGRHGVLPEEQQRAQPFEVDLDIEAPLGKAVRSDSIGDTLDYGLIVAGVVRLIEAGGYQLLETLAGAIADLVLQYDTVSAVSVEVRKLRPPVPHDVASVGVRLRRVKT